MTRQHYDLSSYFLTIPFLASVADPVFFPGSGSGFFPESGSGSAKNPDQIRKNPEP